MAKLTTAQTKFLRALAHHLNPVLWVGAAGVSESVLAELDQTLNDHELVKVKLLHDDRELRQQLIEALCQSSSAVKVQSIGKMVVLYRPNPKNPKLTLPKG